MKHNWFLFVSDIDKLINENNYCTHDSIRYVYGDIDDIKINY